MQRYKIIATIYMFVVIFLTIFYCYDVIFPATFRSSVAFFQTKKYLFIAFFQTNFLGASILRFTLCRHRQRGVLLGAVGNGGVMLVEREEVVIEQLLHLAHGVVDEGGLELALPDDNHLPSVILQHAVVLLVTLLVPPDLRHPKFPIGAGYFAALRTCQPSTFN